MSSRKQRDSGGSKKDKGKKPEGRVENTQQMRPPFLSPPDPLYVSTSNQSLFAPHQMPRRRSPGWRERSNIIPAGPFAFENVQSNTNAEADARSTGKASTKTNPKSQSSVSAKRKRATSEDRNDPSTISAPTSKSTSKRRTKTTSDQNAPDSNYLHHSNAQQELRNHSLAATLFPEDYSLALAKKAEHQPLDSSILTRLPEDCTLASSEQPTPISSPPAQALPELPEPPCQAKSSTSISDRVHLKRRGSQQRDTVPSHHVPIQDDSESLESGEIRSSPDGVLSSHTSSARDNFGHLAPSRVSSHRSPTRYDSKRPEPQQHPSPDGVSSSHTPSRFIRGHQGPYAVSLPHSERRELRRHHLAGSHSSRRTSILYPERPPRPREQSGRSSPRRFLTRPAHGPPET